MAEMVDSSPKTPIGNVTSVASIHQTPPPKMSLVSPNPATINLGKATPDRLKLPKAFKYPERYTSPTDLMMSPISKGLLARSRKLNILPPSKIPHKGSQLQEMGVSQN